MENPLRVTPVPSSPSSSSGLRRSPTSWKLSNMARMLDEQPEELSSNCDSRSSSPRVMLRKPPRHSNVPMCAQILLKLWQRELRRTDVSITSDLFEDLDASDEQAFFLVERMQRMGFNISLQQFFGLQRCCIYSVLLVAL
ncbi:hypothetical protein PybrP1_009159 [[Pythium] brassicae (nom. inval.)]|nr:hypothetical protein PybrP1_009159 [[Pythium] brassicae (nom. inval.)]